MTDGPAAPPELPPPSPRLTNDDLAPATERTWGTYSLFAMWMSDVHSIGGYTFAAGLFFLGLFAWQVFLALVIGIAVVFLLMNLTGFAGQRTGAPFPVIARISFGVFADYYLLRRQLVAVPELYVDGPASRYYYRGGWNPVALAAFVPSAGVCLVLALVPAFAAAAPYSWFVGVLLAGGLYLIVVRRSRTPSAGRI